MASVMPADSSENLQPSQRNGAPAPATFVRDRLLIKENVFLDLFAIVFKEQKFFKK